MREVEVGEVKKKKAAEQEDDEEMVWADHPPSGRRELVHSTREPQLFK
jgi:hypothetical protein